MEWVSEKILKYLNYKDGIYIECGAHDGITQSNTYILEKEYNWHGLLVEPSKEAYEKCKINRGIKNTIINCALVSSEYKEDYVQGDFNGHLMSSVNGIRNRKDELNSVEARKLSDILESCKYEKIDFFSLDVEGYELEVLNGMDFYRHRPTYIMIEVYTKDLDLIFQFMKEKNYELICNLSNFNKVENPHWDGTHNDYLFKSL